MLDKQPIMQWSPGVAPVAVVLISLNEGHNMESVLENLKGWAQEVFLVDSYSKDDTVDIALRYGIYVVQRKFRGFGDQWNFALRELPITAQWTMKIDPDERLSDELKANLLAAMGMNDNDGLSLDRKLWFMGRPLPVRQTILRLWRTGNCRFTDIAVNEHPLVDGRIVKVRGEMSHLDSPDLDHWLHKQNCYTTSEAIIAYQGSELADTPRFFGTKLQRRMWLKRYYHRLPFRFLLLFLYHYLWQGSWRAGRVGFCWARLRADVMRLIEYKALEMRLRDRLPVNVVYGLGRPDPRVPQFD